MLMMTLVLALSGWPACYGPSEALADYSLGKTFLERANPPAFDVQAVLGSSGDVVLIVRNSSKKPIGLSSRPVVGVVEPDSEGRLQDISVHGAMDESKDPLPFTIDQVPPGGERSFTTRVMLGSFQRAKEVFVIGSFYEVCGAKYPPNSWFGTVRAPLKKKAVSK